MRSFPRNLTTEFVISCIPTVIVVFSAKLLLNWLIMDLSFELSEEEIKGLKLLNNEINEEITKKLIVNAVKQMLIKGPGKKLKISNLFSEKIHLEFETQIRPKLSTNFEFPS